MSSIVIDAAKLTPEGIRVLVDCCPFGAINIVNGKPQIGEGCRLCKKCIKADICGAVTVVEEEHAQTTDIDGWQGICVVADFTNGRLHPVTLELLGKALELAESRQTVDVLLCGHGAFAAADNIAQYGPSNVYVYDDITLEYFDPVRYGACVEDYINRVKPAIVMFGATDVGRSLAPRMAARFSTGLTADCTKLAVRNGNELLQVRPAFGGNIMAQIITKYTRPQMCTVRYKVFDAPKTKAKDKADIIKMQVPIKQSGMEILSAHALPVDVDLSEADAIVAVGRGCANAKLVSLARELAGLLNAQLACTRPMVESGIFAPNRQIGLSGRTVKPSLIIALGISGAVQFAAGMEQSSLIVAVNKDGNAPIFNIAHVGLYGDVEKFLPEIIAKLKEGSL